ncbi:MAG: ribbon-helix-helix protein, CopG family, partial [Gammaproteobacteria bacterium]
MIKISARLPDEIVAALDVAAVESGRSRSNLIRLAIESYLEDFDDSGR